MVSAASPTDFTAFKQQRTAATPAAGGGGPTNPLRPYAQQFRSAPSPGLSLKDRIAQLQKVRDRLDEMAVGGGSPLSKGRSRSGAGGGGAAGGVAGSSGGGGNSAAALIDRRELERLERRVDDEDRAPQGVGVRAPELDGLFARLGRLHAHQVRSPDCHFFCACRCLPPR
jgi:hypothetical protein